MTTVEQPVETQGTGAYTGRKGSLLGSWLSTTDHKVIGHLYLITSFAFFLIAGLMAMIMRAQLFGPDNHIVSDSQYNELFTMHGTIMLLLFATPLFVGLANEIMPLQIGAPDVAFPRLNILSYYWGYANSLEWATSCPPPRHNFTRIPRIRSERPAFDLHHPDIPAGRPRTPVRAGSGRS
jgi:heme/copper-type cytochrome/quinol oxidase subunit 1